MASDSLPMVQSARGSRPRPSSAQPRPLSTGDDKVVEAGSMWPAERRRPMKVERVFEEPIQQPAQVRLAARNGAKTAAAKSQGHPDPADDAMDALDGLLASLDDERTKQAEPVLTPPTSPLKPTAAPHSQRCGIAPGIALVIAPVADKNKLGRCGRLVLPVPTYRYDDEVAVDSPSSFSIDASPGVYCPLSPTIMSVHLPGSPIPRASELDDTNSSVVIIGDSHKSENYGARPCRVRFEIRNDTVEAHKHAPQAPKRFGTGKLVSRPRGCTLVQANFGGA